MYIVLNRGECDTPCTGKKQKAEFLDHEGMLGHSLNNVRCFMIYF